MGIVNSLVARALGLLDKGVEIDVRKTNRENGEESEEQRLQRGAEVEHTLEDIRDLERIITKSHRH